VPDGNARAPAPGSAQAAKNAAHAMTFPKTKRSQAVEINVSADGGLTIGIDKTGAASRFSMRSLTRWAFAYRLTPLAKFSNSSRLAH
jgi:hypothetical protein